MKTTMMMRYSSSGLKQDNKQMHTRKQMNDEEDLLRTIRGGPPNIMFATTHLGPTLSQCDREREKERDYDDDHDDD